MNVDIPALKALAKKAGIEQVDEVVATVRTGMYTDRWTNSDIDAYVLALVNNFPAICKELEAGRALAEAVEKLHDREEDYLNALTPPETANDSIDQITALSRFLDGTRNERDAALAAFKEAIK